MTLKQLALLALVVMSTALVVEGSHFRGGIVQWRPSTSNGQILITHRIAWRRSFGSNYCDASTIAAGTIIGDGGSLTCQVGCSGIAASLDYQCTDFDSLEDWSSGEKTTTYNTGSVTYFEASFASCCWISTLVIGADSSWEIRVKGQLTARSDNGLVNSSPVSATTPIVRVQSGCIRTITIPVQDADGDDIRCRWASGNECSGICSAFPYGTLSGCVITYNGGGSAGLYAVALQIEDFISTSSNTPMSSVPLQFIVDVFSSTQPCNGVQPVLTGETLPDGSCIPVPFGTTFRTSVVAMVGHSSVSIVDFPTVSPVGVLKSSISQSSYDSLLYYTNITWAPQTSQYGLNIFCYSARDSNSLSSDQRCITLLGGVQGPIAMKSTATPTGDIAVSSGPITFSIGFDQEIGRPSRSSYIRFYDNSGVQAVAIDASSSSVVFPASGSQGTVMTFTVNHAFQPGVEHYILFDTGVAVGTAFCSQESLPVQDATFWRFSTGVDECAEGTDNCSPNAMCTDTDASFYCTCLSGFNGDGVTCNDIDECLSSTACQIYAVCSNMPGSFTCTCIFGVSSDGVTCTVPPNPASPVSVLATNVGTTSVTITWTVPSQQTNNQIVSFTLTLTEAKFGLPALTATVPYSQVSYTFTGLEEFDSYTCDIISVSEYGFSSAASSVAFDTLEAAPVAFPVMTGGEAVSSTLIRVFWTRPAEIDINGAILFYVVELIEVYTGQSFTFHAVHTQTEIIAGPLHPYFEYQCRVAIYTTALGPFTSYFTVFSGEEAPASPPQNVIVDNTTPITASLLWDAPPYEDQNGIIRYYFVYVTEVGGSTGTIQLQTADNTTAYTVQNLLPSFSYDISITAFTVDEGPSTLAVTVTLPELPPTAPPENLNGYPIDDTTIYFEWDPPPYNQRNGFIIHYIVDVIERETGQMSQQTTTVTNITLTSLHPYYIYDCSVTAVTVGPGPFSPTFAIRAHPAAPSDSPQNVIPVFPDPYSIQLSWDPPPPEHRNGPIIGYIINVTEVQTGEVTQFLTNVTQLTVTSLQPFTVYICIFAAQTPVGTGPFSVQYMVTTPEDIPSPPLSPTVTVPTDPYSLYFGWSTPAKPNGIILKFTVYCEKDGIGPGGGTPPSLTSSDDLSNETISDSVATGTSLTLTGLTPYTRYYCFIAASTSVGESNFSSVITAVTEEYVPDDAPVFIAIEPAAYTISLTWEPPVVPNGVVISYTISYNLTSSGNVTVLVDPVSYGTQYTITGLDPFTYYEFVITAETKFGSGPYSVIIVRTAESNPDSPPTNIQPSVISSTSASVTWLLPPEEDRNGVIIYYTLLLQDVQFNTSDIIVNVSGLSYQFVNLHEYAQYSLQIAAATSAGLGPFSLSNLFTTYEDIPSAPPQLVSGIAHSSTLGTFLWSPPPPLEVNGILRYYIVEVTERYTGRSWSFFAIDEDISIGSLHPYYYYDCIVAAYTINFGPYSLPVSLQTLQDSPTAPPEQLSVIAGSYSLTLMWNPPPFEDTNGVIQYYDISVAELDTGLVYTSTVNSVVTNIQGLHPFYTYQCVVAAFTVGQGPYSDPITVQLNEEAPSGPPTNVASQAISSDSIYISWDPPLFENQNGVIRNYMVYVTELDTGVSTLHTSLTTDITLFSLHPFYNYDIAVSAVTVGEGPTSQFIIVQTFADVPNSPVQNPSVSDFTTDTVILSWMAPPLEDRNGIIIEYKVNVMVVATGNSFELTSTAENITVTSLRPFTNYWFQIAAVTDVGTGPYSTILSITTLQAAPESPPEDVMLSAIDSTSIFVSWSPPPPELQNGVITEYRLNITEVETGSEFLLVSGTTSIMIQFLHPFYTYECIVSAYTIDEGPYSMVATITTPEDVPSGFPENFSAVATTSRSAVLSWEPPLDDVQNGVIVNYTIDVSVAGTNQVFQLYTSMTSLTLSTLLPYRTYFCVISASTIVGQGPPSTVFTLTTPEDAPTASPSVTTYFAQDSTTIMLSWSPPVADEHNGIIREYRIQVLEIETGNISFYNSFSTSIGISSLHPDYTYDLSVSAVTVAAGPYSGVVTITTPEDVPNGPPRNINQVFITSTTIELSWDLPSPGDRNGDIIGYSVKTTALEISETNTQFVVGEQLELTDLRPFTTYSIAIAAQTAVGTGPFSRVFEVQTLEDAPTSHPSNLTGIALNATHIFLRWDPPPENATNGIIREYRINVTEILTGDLLYYTTDPDTRQLFIGPLHPFYIYQCVIVAHTIEPGPFTDAIFVRTEESAPSGPPQNVSISIEDSRSISLSWDPPLLDEQNGILRQYIVTITSSFSSDTHTVQAFSTSITLSALRPYTTYTCSVLAVTTGPGPASTLMQITTPEDVPTGSPQSIVATAISPTELFISWELPVPERKNGRVRRYAVNTTELETMREETFYTQSNNITLMSRHPFYQYQYSVSAETIAFGPFSSSEIIQMPEAAPSASPISITTSSVTSTSFQLMWSEPPPDTHNGVIRNYEIILTDNDSGSVTEVTTQRDSTEFDNLRPYTNYSYQLRAVTISPGPLSTTRSVQTLEDVPAAAPQNFSVQVLSSTSVFVSWGPLPRYDRNGVILGYLVAITRLDTGTTTNTSTSSSTYELLVENLSFFTSYSISVQAFTVIGHGPANQPMMVTTLEDAPSGAPTSLVATNVTSTTISLSWSPLTADLHNGVIRHYLIDVLEVNTNTNYTILTLPHTTFTIGDLHPYYTYELSVHAVTMLPGPPSVPVTVLTSQDIPIAAPVTIESFPLDPTTLGIEWEEPPLEFQNGIILDYTVNISEVETGNNFELASGGLTTITITGLHPYYTYVFTIAASTTVGRGPFSPPNSVRLPEDAPSTYPLRLAGEVTNSTAIFLSWQHPVPEGRNGIIIFYDVRLTELATGQVLEYTQVGSHIELLIASLHPYYEYECSVAARTSVGRGPYSPVIKIRTDEDAPSGPPVNGSVTAVDSRTVLVSWDPPTPETVNGIIRLYYVRVVNGVTGESSILNTTDEFLTVSDLHPFYAYSFSVAGSTTDIGVYSSSLSITLPQDAPTGVPLNVGAVSVSSTSIRITWEPPQAEEQNGVITAYHITVLETQTGALRTLITDVTDNLLIVNSLHPFYDYNCTVAAYTVGLGPASSVAVQTLPEEPSDVPQNIAVSALSPTRANMSWAPPLNEHQNGIIVGYIVRVSGVNSEEELELTVLELSTEITGLHPFYSYRFSVAAETIAPGPFNNPVTLKMPESVPSESPTNLTLVDATTTSVDIGWYPSDPDTWNGLLTRYIVNYQLIRSREESVSSNVDPVLSFSVPAFGQPLVNEQDPTRIDSSLLMETVTINGLEEYYVYEFSIYYETSVGRSPSSSSLSVETLATAPSGPPTMIKATAPSASSSSLVVEWMPPEIRLRNGLITGYNVILINRDTMEETEYNVEVLNFHLEGLPSYTDFEVSVAALSESGKGPYSAPVFIKTLESTPSSPRSVTVKIENSTVALVSWFQPETPNGIILEYQIIYYGVEPKLLSEPDITEIEDGPHTQSLQYSPDSELIVVIRGLKSGLSYEFLVRARTSVGYGANSTAARVEIAQVGQLEAGSSSSGAAIGFAILGWLIIILFILIVIAVLYIRRKYKFKNFTLLRTYGNNTYEIPSAFAVNNEALSDFAEGDLKRSGHSSDAEEEETKVDLESVSEMPSGDVGTFL